MKILIFGSTGRAGQRLCLAAGQAGHRLVTPTRSDCDLLHPQAVESYVLQSGADAVINCAAISGLEACLENKAAAYQVNSLAPEAMARACREKGVRFIHLSTDYVLEGSQPGLHGEEARCAPTSVYAASKWEGERRVSDTYAASILARVSWICGNPQRPSFVENAVARALAGVPLAAIGDKTSLPTHADDLAQALLALAQSTACGVFHICSSGEPLSWWDCARVALQALVEDGLLPALPPLARQTLDTVPFFQEPRPRHTAMGCFRLAQVWGRTLPPAQEALTRAARQHAAFLRTRCAARE